MNISATLDKELKRYLKQQANNGDLEAQTLLLQLQQIATSPPAPIQQAMDVAPSDSFEMGC